MPIGARAPNLRRIEREGYPMHRRLWVIIAAGLAALLGQVASYPLHAQGTAALGGRVSSSAEGPMEGVLVSAKMVGSTITITVVSDQAGRFAFPSSKLAPG